MSGQRWQWSVQHPAIRVDLLRTDGAFAASLPNSAAIYVLLSLTLQTVYVGQSRQVQDRVPGSIAEQGFPVSHVLVVSPLGLPWTDSQLDTLEAALIDALPASRNRVSGQHREPIDDYLGAVISHVQASVALLICRPGSSARLGPTQGQIARDLVLSERTHPPTVAQIMQRLRELGFAIQGQTPWRTLRRDLCDARRGGSPQIRAAGQWSAVTETAVYVDGRRYLSGWRPPRS